MTDKKNLCVFMGMLPTVQHRSNSNLTTDDNAIRLIIGITCDNVLQNVFEYLTNSVFCVNIG